jgi:hypothetical protein
MSEHFMEPEGSLEPFTGPYSEPDESSSYHPILFFLISVFSLLSFEKNKGGL